MSSFRSRSHGQEARAVPNLAFEGLEETKHYERTAATPSSVTTVTFNCLLQQLENLLL